MKKLKSCTAMFAVLAVLAGCDASKDAVSNGGQGKMTPSAMSYMHFGAHSDDQSGMFSTMARFSIDGDSEGHIMVISDSGGGGNSLAAMSREDFVEVRKVELIEAMKHVGVESTDQDYQDLHDFYYTLFAEEAASRWQKSDEGYVCRIIQQVRKRKPDVLVGMWPAPGTHGQHQWAGRIAITAYNKAGDPAFCPGEYEPYEPKKLYLNSYFAVAKATQHFPSLKNNVITIFNGDTVKGKDIKYSDLNQKARRTFISQGWQHSTVRPGDEGFLLLGSRVPVKDPKDTAGDIPEEKFLFKSTFPDGVTMEVKQSDKSVALNRSMTVSVELAVPAELRGKLSGTSVGITAPDGFEIDTQKHEISAEALKSGKPVEVSFTATPKHLDTMEGLQRFAFTLESDVDGQSFKGSNFAFVDVTAPVEGGFKPTYEIENFHNFAAENNIGWMNLGVFPRVPLIIDSSNNLTVRLENHTDSEQMSEVELSFVDSEGNPIAGLEPIRLSDPVPVPVDGREISFVFKPSSADLLKGGKNSLSVTGILKVSTGGGVSTNVADVLLVPSASITTASADKVVVDGNIDDIKAGRSTPDFNINYKDLWQGKLLETSGPDDIGAKGYMTYDNTALYIGLEIDDNFVACDRNENNVNSHWLTDSVEIAIDRRQYNSDDIDRAGGLLQQTGDAALFTGRTFKVGILPCVNDGNENVIWGARAYRDADANPGLVNLTGTDAEVAANKAPGFEAKVSKVDASRSKGDHYVMEVKIPWDTVPSRASDGSAMAAPTAGEKIGVNVLLYEYDIEGKGSTVSGRRLGWASLRGDQQAVPYIWPVVELK